ncbi:MFS-type transporter SLC18B1-like [Lingula anatina]|uniref:MFS-type transporter SLC18B1-like n=1 Tax=Lingula anatina TaxID=7574 RepID=A0A1S3H3E4_LINAN|nr:MFS-type transporter SLC18B1-like [Lingula anatina]|eukprot:XP_013380472.1 MFS-type transporter SLC18B1-like [Lingula anatina]
MNEEIENEKEGRGEEIENEKEGRSEKVNTGGKLLKLSSRQKFTLMNGALSNIAVSVSYSVLLPFLRDVAVKKGVSLTGAGAILGCYEVAFFCCSLTIGSQLSRVGARRCFYTGALVTGVSSLAFGFLDACPPGDTFLALAISIRVLESIGASMSFTSNYALATREFRDNTATAYGFLETFAGLGHVLGPLIGGSLYQLGGFGLSFFVSAPLTIITATVAFFTLPTEKEEQGNLIQVVFAKLPVELLKLLPLIQEITNSFSKLRSSTMYLPEQLENK